MRAERGKFSREADVAKLHAQPVGGVHSLLLHFNESHMTEQQRGIACCRSCHGTRWWTERPQPKGLRCVTCLPSDHLPVEAVRREGEGDVEPALLFR